MIDKKCPKCGSELLQKTGRYGEFLGCTKYPECRFIENLSGDYQPKETGEQCPECGKNLLLKKGRYGDFTACSGYPECRYIKRDENSSRPKPTYEQTDVVCDKCGQGKFRKLMGKKGPFFACNKYPECKNTKTTLDEFN